MAKKSEVKEAKQEKVVLAFRYLCPACTNVAIETSNCMLGVKVNCKSCGKLITLDDLKRYQKLDK